MTQQSLARGLCRDARVVRRLAPIALLISNCAWAQISHLDLLDASTGLPGGFRINSFSAYAADTSLGQLNLASGSSTNTISLGTMASYGTSADIGWLSQGPRTQFVIDYRADYNGNARFSSLNGFDHSLSFSLRTMATPRLMLSFEGHGESTTVMGSLYAITPGLSVVQGASSVDQLGSSLTSNLGTVGTGAAPLAFGLFGSRFQTVALGVTARFDQTSRLSWHWSAFASRTFPSSTNSTSVGSIAYPAFTEGTGEFGFTYMLSRRTTIGGGVDYQRNTSVYARFQAPSGALTLTHVLTPNWFLEGEGGYGVMKDSLSRTASWLREYRGGGGVGTKRGSNAFLLSARRQMGDAYGLGGTSTLEGALSWRWQRPAGNWSVDNSAGYQRISGSTLRMFQGWVYQGGVTRKLTRVTSISLQGVYAGSSGGFTNGTSTYNRNLIRLALNWTPGAVRR